MKNVLLSLLLVLGLAVVGCGSDDGDDTTPTDVTQGTDVPVTPGDDVPVTPGDDVVVPPPAANVAITFRINTNTMADGTNKLAEVKTGEMAFVVGGNPAWYTDDTLPQLLGQWGSANGGNPQDPNFAMTDKGAGVFEITLDLPMGNAAEYKFLKTSTVADDNWAGGIKFLMTQTEWEAAGKACNAETPNPDGGLFETGNFKVTVPAEIALPETCAADTDCAALTAPTNTDAAGTELGGAWKCVETACTFELTTIDIEAWRDLAETFGYVTCD